MLPAINPAIIATTHDRARTTTPGRASITGWLLRSSTRDTAAMRFSVYQVSRKGGREKNEDRVGYCYTRDSGLFALADGMGGHPEGEVASQLALT